VGFTDKKTLYLPGTIDTLDGGNTKLAVAGQILNGMNNYEGSYEISTDEDGAYVLNFNYSFKGEPQEKITTLCCRYK
jgi:hypothetical protein